MASAAQPLRDVTTLKTPLSSSSFGSTPKPSQLFLLGKRNHGFKVSCKVSNNDQKHNQNNDTNSSVDRRNVLLGLSGLYGAANVAAPLIASANPVKTDISSCGLAVIDDNKSPDLPSNRVKCCLRTPDDPTNIPYYKLPPVSKLRIRPAAHDVDKEYIDKYNEAYRLMKELDRTNPNDPRGFTQQALIHCAYCNGSYKDGGQVLQIHGSWLFFPFHRWYLYFHERILGSLINDPTFGLPYWNWDHPKGMRMPPMFDGPEIVNRQGKTVKNNLYDIKRNMSHRGKTLLDLGSYGTEAQATDLQVMSNNLTLMYRQMITNAPCAQLFFGKKYRSGDDYKKLNGTGTIENIPHTPVHIWVGGNTADTPNHEDMGNFYSAGYDPVFYSHHTNVDRMWTIWKTLGGKRKDFPEDEKDFHDAEFFFYDENQKPYKVKVKDCLDSRKMGYDFQPMATPWRNFKPLKKTSNNSSSIPAPSGAFKPIQRLDKVITFSVPRTNKTEGNQKGESLILGGVAHDGSKHIRFDVFLNVDVKNHKFNELDSAEFLGSYISLPHVVHGHEDPSDFQVVITESIEQLNLQNQDTINVTLVPKAGGELVSVQSAQITLENC